jgi:hypothetical protein
MYSYDGYNWLPTTVTSTPEYSVVCWSSELRKFVAISNNFSGKVITSTNGIDWNMISLGTDYLQQWSSLIWVPELSLFVAVSTKGTSRAIMTSKDGEDWNLGTIPAIPIRTVAYSTKLELMVALGPTNTALVSSDGFSWTTILLPLASDWSTVIWSAKLATFVAGSASTEIKDPSFTTNGKIIYSVDGLNWLISPDR